MADIKCQCSKSNHGHEPGNCQRAVGLAKPDICDPCNVQDELDQQRRENNY